MYMDIIEWIDRHLSDDLYNIKDKIAKALVHYTFYSMIEIKEDIEKINIMTKLSNSLDMYSEILMTSGYNSKDDIGVYDKLWITLT